MPRDTGGYVLPVVLQPEEYDCVTIRVPREPYHKAAFWGAIRSLSYWYNWQRDEDKLGTIVAKYWQALVDEASENAVEGDCTVMAMSCEELKACIGEAVVDAGKGILAGGLVSISQDEDGNFVVGTGGTEDGFVDEDGDGIDDNTGQRIPLPIERVLGSAYGVPQGIQRFMNDVKNLNDNGSTDGAIALILNSVYDVQEGVVTELWVNQWTAALDGGTNNPDLDDTAIAGYVYCQSPIRTAVNRYIFFGTTANNVIAFMQYVMEAVTDEQLQQWYDEGADQPRTNFTDMPCYLQPTFSVQISNNDLYAGGTQWKSIWQNLNPTRLIRVTFNGIVQDDASAYREDAWYITDENGDVTFRAPSFQQQNPFRGYNGFIVEDPQYSPDGIYVIEMEVDNTQVLGTAINGQFDLGNTNGFTGNPVGTITITFEDLGAIEVGA